MVSLTGLPWWDSWIEARMALGLVVEGVLDVPIMNRFDASGRPTDQSLAASEIGELLRQILGIETNDMLMLRNQNLICNMLVFMCFSPMYICTYVCLYIYI